MTKWNVTLNEVIINNFTWSNVNVRGGNLMDTLQQRLRWTSAVKEIHQMTIVMCSMICLQSVIGLNHSQLICQWLYKLSALFLMQKELWKEKKIEKQIHTWNSSLFIQSLKSISSLTNYICTTKFSLVNFQIKNIYCTLKFTMTACPKYIFIKLK